MVIIMAMQKNENGVSKLVELKNSVSINEKVFLDPKEASALGGIGYAKVYELVKRPDVDFVVKQGRRYLVHREKFIKWLSEATEF